MFNDPYQTEIDMVSLGQAAYSEINVANKWFCLTFVGIFYQAIELWRTDINIPATSDKHVIHCKDPYLAHYFK